MISVVSSSGFGSYRVRSVGRLWCISIGSVGMVCVWCY